MWTYLPGRLFLLAALDVSQGNLVSTIDQWGKYFQVSAEIQITGLPTENWANVFHFTTGENNYELGSRIPGLWVNKSNQILYFTSGVDQEKDYEYSHEFSLGQKYLIDILQIPHGNGEALYQIRIDGNLVHNKTNSNAMDFDNVKVYLSDPWYESFQGKLTNFQWDKGTTKYQS